MKVPETSQILDYDTDNFDYIPQDWRRKKMEATKSLIGRETCQLQKERSNAVEIVQTIESNSIIQ